MLSVIPELLLDAPLDGEDVVVVELLHPLHPLLVQLLPAPVQYRRLQYNRCRRALPYSCTVQQVQSFKDLSYFYCWKINFSYSYICMSQFVGYQ